VRSWTDTPGSQRKSLELTEDGWAIHERIIRIARKREALAAHVSQKNWLDVSQGMDSYLVSMDEASQRVGLLSGQFEFAEGWRRHLHLGFSAREIDPLKDALGEDCLVNEAYEAWLELP
jgi:hypothetical protein